MLLPIATQITLRSASEKCRALVVCFAAVMSMAAPVARSQPTAASADTVITDAREALRKRDRVRLASARASAIAANHPLASWVAYWELSNRLGEASADELEAFYSRWAGTYVEDRLRNDWLLELGRRRDWATFARDVPRFRMNDDRSVTCYTLLIDHLAGKDVRDAARAAWTAQTDADNGCQLLASTMLDARRFDTDDVWRKVRLSVAAGKPRAANAAAALFDATLARRLGEAIDNPARLLGRGASSSELVGGAHKEDLLAIALARAATSNPTFAAEQLRTRWANDLSDSQAAWAWAAIGQQAAMDLETEAAAYYGNAWNLVKRGRSPDWGDDILGWNVRAALRSARGAERWKQAHRAIDEMSPGEQREPTWAYWKARSLLALAKPLPAGVKPPVAAPAVVEAPPSAGASAAELPASSASAAVANIRPVDPLRAEAQALLESIASPWTFYGALALEELGRPITLPAKPAPITPAERDAARTHAGFARALQLIALGLRGEGVREWNYALRGLTDRELIAAAQLACDREVWDRCINSSDRTRTEIDVSQRFPTPFRGEVLEKSRAIGLDPAYVYGLIRQESRFIMDARSSVGASGLMQLMPATARITAKKIGLDFRPDMVTDRDVNLRLGTAYLKMALDDVGGSQAMAAAAYNAGPGRPRRWREGPVLEPAIWAENIPFSETRDYVKKVLSNATLYAALLGQPGTSLKARLGADIGPRDPNAPAINRELP